MLVQKSEIHGSKWWVCDCSVAYFRGKVLMRCQKIAFMQWAKCMTSKLKPKVLMHALLISRLFEES